MSGYKNPPVHAQFKPGQSGNPKGRPRGRSLTAILAEELQKCPPGKRKTNAELIVKKLIDLALDGDRQAIKDICDRIDGKVPDRLDVTSTAPTVEDLAESLKASEERYEHAHRNGHHPVPRAPGDGASAGESGPV